jgi:hypothetical protein
MIAESRVRIHLLHQIGKVICGINFPSRIVERGEGVGDGARAGHSDDFIDGALGSGEAIVLHLLERGDIGLRTPEGWLIFWDILGDRNCDKQQERE